MLGVGGHRACAVSLATVRLGDMKTAVCDSPCHGWLIPLCLYVCGFYMNVYIFYEYLCDRSCILSFVCKNTCIYICQKLNHATWKCNTYLELTIYIYMCVCVKICDNVTYEGFRVLDCS